jgi:putative DNA primase/helicase
MTFADIASPYIALGVPVFPLSPKSKVPPAGMEFLIEATIDPAKVAQWNAENPNFNAAILANGDYCFLEFDQLGIKAAAKEMGKTVPETRTQKSGSGGGHLIFRHTDRSRALGNRQASLNGHEWFSFRASNRYLVAGGSTHPNGQPYKTVRDVDPIPVPDWVCDWIELHTAPAKVARNGGEATVSDEFDFEDMMDFFEIAGSWDGDWFICDECPIAGYRHEQSTRTGFFFDGNTLGFHCFAGGCAGSSMSVGDVIGFLNKQKGERYKGVIWEQDDSDLDGVEAVDDDAIPESVLAGVPVRGVSIPEPAVSVEKADAEEPVSETVEPQSQSTTDPDIRYASYTENDDFNSGLLIKSADKFLMTELSWMWPQKIPKGKVIFFTGKPDCGKSLTLLDVIARVSTGADWPDGSRNEMPPSRVLIAFSEDDPSDTLVPRLAAAGADLSKVELVIGTMVEMKTKGKPRKKRRTNLNLKRDCKMLLQALKDNPDIALLALDPITSFFGEGTDANLDKDVRPVMDEITKMCNKSGLTVIGLIHSNKRSDVDAVGKVSGATALAASVRAVWGFSKDGEDKSLYHMAHVKGNLAKDKSGLNYSIEGMPVQINGKAVEVPRIVWGEKLDADANDILQQERSNKDTKDFKLEAAKLLIKTQRFPIKAKDLYEIGEGQGISSSTLKNAKGKLFAEGFYIVAKKGHDGWYWHTMDEATSRDEVTMPEGVL